LPRNELVQAFRNADLFVFASKIEYSPLVLFECAAAHLPFLTVDVGNSVEIAEWTGCGMICPSIKDSTGYSCVDETALTELMAELTTKKAQLTELGNAGRKRFEEAFTWQDIAIQYEQIFNKIKLSRDHN
jgi:glycosyltransferase involved in cell wall biosynthesis